MKTHRKMIYGTKVDFLEASFGMLCYTYGILTEIINCCNAYYNGLYSYLCLLLGMDTRIHGQTYFKNKTRHTLALTGVRLVYVVGNWASLNGPTWNMELSIF